jgi:hypothetical protein
VIKQSLYKLTDLQILKQMVQRIDYSLNTLNHIALEPLRYNCDLSTSVIVWAKYVASINRIIWVHNFLYTFCSKTKVENISLGFKSKYFFPPKHDATPLVKVLVRSRRSD